MQYLHIRHLDARITVCRARFAVCSSIVVLMVFLGAEAVCGILHSTIGYHHCWLRISLLLSVAAGSQHICSVRVVHKQATGIISECAGPLPSLGLSAQPAPLTRDGHATRSVACRFAHVTFTGVQCSAPPPPVQLEPLSESWYQNRVFPSVLPAIIPSPDPSPQHKALLW